MQSRKGKCVFHIQLGKQRERFSLELVPAYVNLDKKLRRRFFEFAVRVRPPPETMQRMWT